MKILIATPLYPPEIGGPATFVETIEALLPERGYKLTIVKFSDVRKYPKIIRHIIYGITLYRKAKNADIIVALDPVSVGLPARIVAKLRKKKFVVRIVGDYAWEQGMQRFKVTDQLDVFSTSDKYSFPVRMLKKIETWVAAGANRVIVPSEYLKKIVINWGVKEKRIAVIYNAFEVPTSALTKATAKTKLGFEGTILFSAGRLVPWKGFKTLIEIFPDILKSHPESRLVIAGDGPLENELKKQAEDLGIGARISFVGRLAKSDFIDHIRATDVYVQNTSYEGFSHQLLEVMALGTPLVTTNVGGNPELVSHGENGLLVSFDDKEALKTNILYVLDNPGAQTMLGEAGAKHAATYTKTRMVDAFNELLRIYEEEVIEETAL